MGMLTAPYNNAMRLGCGFNSFTQTLCVNDAVIKDNRKSATEDDLQVVGSNDGDEVSQIVTWNASFVEHASEVANSLDIKGNVQVKIDGLGGGGGSAAYLNTEAMKESDINYLLQVKVVNQKLVANDVTRFNPIPNLGTAAFTDTYGDSFISGFVEGGEFYALMSIKVTNKEKIQDIKGSLNVEIKKPALDVEASAEGEKADKDMMSDTETNISVIWSGGGQIRTEEESKDDWTFATLRRAANLFPDKVAKYPQRTQAILTKYGALRSYQEMTNKGSPLDYENAGVYTNALLDAYMDYKSIWKLLTTLQNEVDSGKKLRYRPGDNSEFAPYAEASWKDYQSKMQTYYGKDLIITDSDKATSNDATPNGVSSDALVKVDGASSSVDSKNTAATLDQQLIEAQNNLVIAKKELAVMKSNGVYDPPLKPNPIKLYHPSIFGLDAARTDCRWEMIKIVKEVDAVTVDPRVAIDFTRILDPPPPPYSDAYMTEVKSGYDKQIDGLNQSLKAKDAVFDEMVKSKNQEIEAVKLEMDKAIEQQKELEQQHLADKDKIIGIKDNDILLQVQHEAQALKSINETMDDMRANEKKAIEDAVSKTAIPLNNTIMSQESVIANLTQQIKDATVTDTDGAKAVQALKELQVQYDVVKASLDNFQRDNAQYTRELVDAVSRVEGGKTGPQPPAGAQEHRPFYGETYGGLKGAKNFALEENIHFEPPLVSVPQMICSLTWIEFVADATKDGPSMTCGARAAATDSFILSRGVGDHAAEEMCSMWLALPNNQVHFESGTVESTRILSQIDANHTLRQTVRFRRPYGTPPKVVAWIMGAEFVGKNLARRLRVNVESITTHDCVITAGTWFDSVVRNAKVGWLAFDADTPNVTYGNGALNYNGLKTDALPLARDPTKSDLQFSHKTFNTTSEKGPGFTRDPALFTGYTLMDLNGDKNFRMGLRWKNITNQGFDWMMTTWSDTLLWEVDAFWLAIA